MQVQSSAEVGCIEVQVLRSHLIFVLSHEARAKYKGMCQEIFGSEPVDVSDSSEEEFDRGTFADALQQRNFLSPLIQDPVAKNKPKAPEPPVEPVRAEAKAASKAMPMPKNFAGRTPPNTANRSWRFAAMKALWHELYKPITKKNKLEQWYDFVTQADLDMENIKTEEEMSERVRYIRGFDKFGSEWRLRYAPPRSVLQKHCECDKLVPVTTQSALELLLSIGSNDEQHLAFMKPSSILSVQFSKSYGFGDMVR
ncbi:pol [Symbiodinium sp. CCMP2592]|nr:pol [Symbiodinium sp. CCMP2592]